jgi:hypothetical protein
MKIRISLWDKELSRILQNNQGTVHGVFTYIVPIIYLYAIYSVSEQIEIMWYTIYGIH